MTKAERLKEEISFEKQRYFILVAAGLGVLGWLFSNALKADLIYTVVAVSAVVVDGAALAFMERKIKNKIRALEEL